MITLDVNNKKYDLDVDADTPLLWVLREQLGLTGTKYSCGIGQCGNCTVLVDNEAVIACTRSAGDFIGKKITTIESLAQNGKLHPVQQAWLEQFVPECGYCQSGQIMTATALLARNPDPSDEEINRAMDRVLCRCGTYSRIRKAIKRASDIIRDVKS